MQLKVNESKPCEKLWTIYFHLLWIKSAFKSNIYDYIKLKGVSDEYKFNEFWSSVTITNV